MEFRASLGLTSLPQAHVVENAPRAQRLHGLHGCAEPENGHCQLCLIILSFLEALDVLSLSLPLHGQHNQANSDTNSCLRIATCQKDCDMLP